MLNDLPGWRPRRKTPKTSTLWGNSFHERIGIRAAIRGMSAWAGIPRLAGVKVLVVERVPDVREIVTAALEQYGASVTAVDSPVTALSLVKRQRPDVLVSSLSMPEKDGYWLIRQVRSLSPDRGGNTPAVAFTGRTTPEDRLNALRAGFQTHVPKPANLQELAGAIALLSLRREAVLAF
jgi:CheY-like chemotaxis protein